MICFSCLIASIDCLTVLGPECSDDRLRCVWSSDLLIPSPGVAWTDIAGLEEAKRLLQENVILPLLMPDYFQGIRRPVKACCFPLACAPALDCWYSAGTPTLPFAQPLS